MKSPLLPLASCFGLGIFLARPEYWPASARLFEQALSISALLVSASLSLSIGLIALGRAKGSATGSALHGDWWRWGCFVAALAGFTAAGAAASRLFEFRFPPNHVSHLGLWGVDLADPIGLGGTVISTPLETPYGLQFEVEVHRTESRGVVRSATGKVRLRLQESFLSGSAVDFKASHLRYGDSIRALVRLRRPRSYRNPGSFDFRRWMESIEDTYWEGTIENRGPQELAFEPQATGLESSRTVRGLLVLARQRLLRDIDRLYPPWTAQGRDGAVLKAVLLGERSSVDSETIENFRKSGLYHLLVIAGLHVGLLAALAELLLRLLRVRESRRSALVLAFLVGYASLVEQRAPTLRATLMIAGYLVARFLYRDHVGLNAIGFAALVLLFSRPAWLFESGFQLSFSAALLIAGLGAPVLERTTQPYRSALYHLEAVDRDPSLAPRLAQFRLDLRSLIAFLKARFPLLEHHPVLALWVIIGPIQAALWTLNIVLFSAILQLGLLLPMAEIFHRVTFAGIGLNALAIPVMTVLLALAVPTVILGATIPALAVWPAKAVAVTLAALFALAEMPDLSQWLSYRVPDPPLWLACGFALSIVAAACVLGRSRRAFWTFTACFAVLAALICLPLSAPQLPTDVLELTALDCGGGDAIFVVLPDQTTVLIGAGGRGRARSRLGGLEGGEGASGRRRGDPGENIVSPYLWSRGIKKIDLLVLADSRGDHVSGFASVVANFRIGEFWHGPSPLTPPFAALLEQVDRRRIPVRQVAAGDMISRGTTAIEVLWPPQAGAISVFRDDSVVMRVVDGERSAVLAGDVSKSAEQALLGSGVPLQSQVLTVAHGAALVSSASAITAFLGRISPRVAIVNAQNGGAPGFPSPDTLDPLRTGVRVFRTDLLGAVTAEMSGASPAVHCYAANQTGHPDPLAWRSTRTD